MREREGKKEIKGKREEMREKWDERQRERRGREREVRRKEVRDR